VSVQNAPPMLMRRRALKRRPCNDDGCAMNRATNGFNSPFGWLALVVVVCLCALAAWLAILFVAGVPLVLH